VRAEARPGLVVATEGPYLAALQTELTPALVKEGLAREFVRRVQDLRKQAEFDISDRIQLFVQATPGLAIAIENQKDYIMGETLAVELILGEPPARLTGANAAAQAEFDGESVAFTILRNA
jgi:isoleucyl-tRNA synthetase